MKSILIIFIIVSNTFSPLPLIDTTLGEKKEAGKIKKNNRKSEVNINFFLLNQEGQPSNTFNEGENITFSLSIENNSDDSLYMDNSFLATGNGFCEVYKSDNTLVGRPFSSIGAQIVSSAEHPFYGNQKEFLLKIPWQDSRANWSILHHNFRSTNQKSLPKGKYYTTFKHRFCFDRSGDRPSLCVPETNVRIDFEVI